MKEHYFPKIIIAVLLMIISISASPSFAQTKTPFPTSKPSLIPTDTGIIDKLKQIEILKEKIATRVAEVRNQQKGAMFGKIISVEKNPSDLFQRGQVKSPVDFASVDNVFVSIR